MIIDILATIFVIFFIINYALLLFSLIRPKILSSSTKKPSFTVIIPNADSGSVLRETLSNIRKSDYTQEKVEIIVVDSTGKEDVIDAVKKYRGRLAKDTISGGKGPALNIGVGKAKNEILYFLDSDTLIEKDALENIAKTISKKTPAVQGIFLPSNKDSLWSLMVRLETILSNIYNFWCWKVLKTCVAGSRNFAIYRRMLLKIGAFEDVLAEDANLARRLYEKNINVAFNCNVISKELVPVKISHMWKQHERWYGGAVRELAYTGKISSFFIIPFLISIAFLHGFLTILSLIFIITGSIFALGGVLIGFTIILHQAAKYLTKEEIILSPVTTIALSVFSLAMLINVILKMLLGIKIGWYKTPKVIKN